MHLRRDLHVAPQRARDHGLADVDDPEDCASWALGDEVAATHSSGTMLPVRRNLIEKLEVRDADGDCLAPATPGCGAWRLHLAFPIVRAVVVALLLDYALGLLCAVPA